MIRLVVGLGNPGSRYNGTRHNIGFAVVDRVATLHGSSRSDIRGGNFVGYSLSMPSCSLLLIKPTTFMNRSGMAVAEVLERFPVELSELLVIVDEFQLATGVVRLRPGGSGGGHNGMASIIQALGTDEFARLRLGVGPLPELTNPAEFVLAPFPQTEAATVKAAVDIAAEAVILAARQSLAAVMSQLNKNPAPPD